MKLTWTTSSCICPLEGPFFDVLPVTFRTKMPSKIIRNVSGLYRNFCERPGDNVRIPGKHDAKAVHKMESGLAESELRAASFCSVLPNKVESINTALF